MNFRQILEEYKVSLKLAESKDKIYPRESKEGVVDAAYFINGVPVSKDTFIKEDKRHSVYNTITTESIPLLVERGEGSNLFNITLIETRKQERYIVF